MSKLNFVLPPALVFVLIAIAMVFTTQFTPSFQWPLIFRGVASGLILTVAVAMLVVCLYAFRRAKTTLNPLILNKASALVCDGLYQYSRNPIYLCLSLLLISLSIWLANIFCLLWFPVFIVYLNTFQIKPEERALLEKFGTDYEDYSQQVNRWI